ncbi:wax ester synthase/diacylglycerol acyltransferase 4-like isoform X1 [Syzygium oleosum]|uniref:wax ester synthase/diacylglycerol acyltransferase 4-like isoform X1 n=1 Tax=Syzygium oleosum TaxID=219896 RepID=UPI0024B96C6F|nr:wax ester synthase/diacylglycerol acyltransferase 4-like isoform X1 [Syzygium oleosum]
MELIKEDKYLEPVSPTGQYFNSKVMSVSVLSMLEFEIPIDDSQTTSLIKDVFLPINPRFSSIMVEGKKGGRKWKKVEVNVENHVHFPSFCSPKGSSSPSENDSFLKSYISQIAMEPFPQGQPLWEIHIIQCPTSEAQGTLIFKLHHALGDGYSLVGALLSCLQRADDPSLPVTFPSVNNSSSVNKDDRNFGLQKVVSSCFLPLVDTVRDFCWSVLKSTCVKDDLTPIRCGSEKFRPFSVSTITFSLNRIKDIKSCLRVTINDVITGVIFLATRLYMQRASPNSNLSTNSTALVLMNTRNLRDYKSLRDMVRPNSKSLWGNNFAFLHVPIPKVKPGDSQFSDPLKFVHKAREVIKRKRSSFGVVLTGKLLEIMKKCRNAEAVAKYISRTLRNSSLVISNVMGPMEKLSLGNHPVKGLYYTVAGTPESLNITIFSYAGNLRVAVRAEQGFIDSELYTRSLLDAFDMIFHDACGKQ